MKESDMRLFFTDFVEHKELLFAYILGFVTVMIVAWDSTRRFLHSIFKWWLKSIISRKMMIRNILTPDEFYGSLSHSIGRSSNISDIYEETDREFIYYLINAEKIFADLKNNPLGVVSKLKDVPEMLQQRERHVKFLIHWRHAHLLKGERIYIFHYTDLNVFERVLFAMFAKKLKRYVAGKSQRFLRFIDYLLEKANRSLPGTTPQPQTWI
jgi:hypothetical protein